MATPTRCTLLWKNLIDSSEWYYASPSLATGYPPDNLYGDNIHKVGRTVNDTGSKVWWIFTGLVPWYDTVIFAGHNLPSSATVRIETDTSWPSAPLTYSMSRGVNCYYYYFDTPNTDNYLAVETVATTHEGVHQIGLIWVGLKLELARNPQIPIGLTREKDTSQLFTGGGQHWSYENYSRIGYNLKFIDNFEPSGTGSFGSLEEMHINRGKGKPFFLDLKPGDSNTPPIFVHTTDWDFSIDGKDMRPGSWTVEQEL